MCTSMINYMSAIKELILPFCSTHEVVACSVTGLLLIIIIFVYHPRQYCSFNFSFFGLLLLGC